MHVKHLHLPREVPRASHQGQDVRGVCGHGLVVCVSPFFTDDCDLSVFRMALVASVPVFAVPFLRDLALKFS